MENSKYKSPLIILSLLIVFYCLDYFYRITPGLVVHQLISQYHTNALGIGLFASSFYLGYTIFQIPSGFLLDKAPFKVNIVVAILLCTISFFIFIYGSSFSVGWLSRFFIGITSSFSFISVLYVARHYLPSRYFSLISGITIAVGTLCSSFIQVITAYFLKDFGWHAILGFFAIVGAVVALFLLNPKLRLPRRLTTDDKRGCQKNSFITVLKQLKQIALMPKLWINGVMGGLFYLPTSLLATAWGIAFFTHAYHLNSTDASTAILMLFIGWAIGSPLVGYLNQKVLHHKYLSIAFAFLAAILSYFTLFQVQMVSQLLYVAMLLFGLFSSAQVSVWKNFSTLCPKEMTGTGVAFTNMLILGTAVVFHAIVGSLIEHAYQVADHFTTQAYQRGLITVPLLFVASAVLAWVLNAPQEDL